MAALAALCSPRVLSQQQGHGSAPAHCLRRPAHSAALHSAPLGARRIAHSSAPTNAVRSTQRSADRRAGGGAAEGEAGHREQQRCGTRLPGGLSQQHASVPCPAPFAGSSRKAPASQCAPGSRNSCGGRNSESLQAQAALAGPIRQALSAQASGGSSSSWPLACSSSSHSSPGLLQINRDTRAAAPYPAFSKAFHRRGDPEVGRSRSLQPFPPILHKSTRDATRRPQRPPRASGDSSPSSSSQHHSTTPSHPQPQPQQDSHAGPKGVPPVPPNGSMGYSDGQGSGAAYVVRRVIWGAGIGVTAFSAILRGEWPFAVLLGLLCGVGCWEFQGLVRRRCALRKLRAPSLGAAAVASLGCGLMPPITLLFGGQVKMALAAGAAAVGAVLLLQPTRPRLSEISSLTFGSLYCGFFATYWIKLRSGIVPSAVLAALPWPPPPGTVSPLQSFLVTSWPSLLGGGAQVVTQPEKWTLGLAATFLGFAGIIAADTGAYVGGKLMGRTPLINISPNKTWEGAFSGLCSCILVSLWVARSLLWPAPPFWTCVLATCVFLAALFGDLSESMLKRDAGVKDAGRLIPGHGGVLDRTDSYIFTGLTVYAFVRFVLPLVATS